MNLLTLEEVKLFLKIDFEDEDLIIAGLIEASESYLENATGKKFNDSNQLASIYCKILINEWYNNRELYVIKGTSNVVKYTLNSILLQLQYGGDDS